MEKDPSLDEFLRSVRHKPEVRLPCADCGELLYLTVKQCPFCKGRSVIKPCAWCHKGMRLFFELAAQQEYCQECTWKLSREQLRCAQCGQPIPTTEEHVTYAQRILHRACVEAFQRKAAAPAASEAERAAQDMERARLELVERSKRAAQAGAQKTADASDAKGCGGAAALALAVVIALVVG